MAKVDIKMPEEFLQKISRLGSEFDAVAESVLEAGGEVVGLPECELNLAHATIFLASAPKSNSATLALFKAKELVANEEARQVPMHLRVTGYE